MLRIGQHACRVASRRYSRSVRPVDPVGVRTLTLTGATSPKTTTTTTTTTTRVCSWRGTKSQPPSSLWTIQTCRYSQPPSPRQPADSPPGAAGRSSDAAPPTSHNHASVVAAQQQFQRLQRAVTDLNLGDQVSVILISVLTVLILASPYWLSHIRRLDQDDYDDLWASSDVIDDLTKLARTEWGREDEVTDDEERHGKGSNALETILRDVMQSQTLQVAAQQFVVAVVSSEPVKAALQRLLAELFRDLIQDKETLAQVIQLLNKVIQDDSIKQAAQALVLDLVAEPDVKEALVGLLQQVAREEPVPTTIIELLKHSAHATLNDTDVLDHSMEFATDVLGDDIVQRTAGEALRNSLGHAVRPASTILFTTLGLGLLVSSVMAVGYARSTEQEVHLFENAVKSFASNAVFGIKRMLTWPGRALTGLGERILYVLLLPVRSLASFGERLVIFTGNAVLHGWNELLLLPQRAFTLAYTYVLDLSCSAARHVRMAAASFVTHVSATGRLATVHSCAFLRTAWRSSCMGFMQAIEKVQDSMRSYLPWSSLLQHQVRLERVRSRIGTWLAQLAIAVEECLERVYQSFFI